MKEILKRLRQARGYLGFKQGEFSKRLKMPQNSYSQIETGVNPIKDRHIALICFTFGINETWLRTGQGEMLNRRPEPPPSTPAIAPVIVDGQKLDPDAVELLDLYGQLENSETRKEIQDYTRDKLELQNLRKQAEKGEIQNEEPKRG
jgi:transcriptional regulator with XRE-family HTH domain